MKISKLDSYFGVYKNYKYEQNVGNNKTNFIQEENYAKIPLETWQAHKINNIQKINFTKNNDKNKNIIYIFLGPPLAGKGTTAKLLSEKKNIPIIGVGAILRENVKKGTELGKIAKTYMDTGMLMPSEIVMDLIEKRIDEKDCQNGFIFDGFPRKINEAKDFIEIIKRKNQEGKNYSIKVINFVIDEDVLMQRAQKRRLIDKRTDDNPETVKNRLEIYYKETKPVEALFNDMGILTNIDTKSKVDNETSQETIFEWVLNSIEDENSKK